MSSRESLDSSEGIALLVDRLLKERGDLTGGHGPIDHSTRPVSDDIAKKYWKLSEKIHLLGEMDRIRRGVDF